MDYLLLGALLKTDGLSEEEKELLREKVLGSMLFTGMQLQELKKLEERMEQAKIPCQPMKGARMKFYYPSPFLREMSDPRRFHGAGGSGTGSHGVCPATEDQAS